jgi:Family of unknown function (DUF5309)
MEYVEKAILDSVQGANLNREDLSNTISLTDGPQRPVSQAAKIVKAKNKNYQWNEQGLNTAGRTNVAGGGATYAEGALPPTNAKAAARKSNVVCKTGRTAQVTDTEMAEFNGGGTLQLADGEMERLINDALEYAAALASVECLNQIEWMHVTGDSSNATMEGGETDGLIKWITANGTTTGSGTSGTPVTMAENLLKDIGRAVQLKFPSSFPNTILAAPELMPDLNGYIANGAGRPLTQLVKDGPNGTADLVAGLGNVGWYNFGPFVCRVKPEPYLSPAYNTALTNPALIGYNDGNVEHAQLIPFHAEGVARTDTSVKRMITCEYAQGHRVVKGTFILHDVVSAIA